MYVATTATRKVMAMQKRLRCVQGGTSASKTVSILLYLIHRSQMDKEPTLTSVISESFPHLKRGSIRDFLSILQTHHYYEDASWNKTDFVYTFPNGSKIEFFSADQPDKVRGPRRDRLFINEANNVPYEAFDQLEVRTKDFIFLDWNPVSTFWFHDEIQNKRNDYEFIILTYKDNEALDKNIIASIEQRQGNKNWWAIYGKGELGVSETRIFKDWAIIDDIPHEARLLRYGLDFGYTNDPTAIVGLYKYNSGYILDEVTYQKGLSNRQIADILLNIPQSLVIADSAEPKSIDELSSYGITVLPAQKGSGSVNQGIQLMQDQRISVTKRSLNLIKEYRNYQWTTDKNGKVLNVPEPGWDHCSDAARYAFMSLEPVSSRSFVSESSHSNLNAAI